MQSRKIGRLRTVAVLAALGVSVLSGALPASAANDGGHLPPGLVKQDLIQADDSLARGWDFSPTGGGNVSTLGWNWAR